MAVGTALHLALSGLKTTQTQLGVTAGNIANAETPGYSRKVATASTQIAGNKVAGVRSEEVTREINTMVQKQWRSANASSAYAKTRLETVSSVDSYFGGPNDASSLVSLYSKFTGSLQTLSTSPDSVANRTAAVSSARSLATRLGSLSENIQTLRQSAETNISNAVDKVNSLLTSISDLDKQVVDMGTRGESTAAVEDKRDAAIDELSGYMDIRVQNQPFGAIAISTTNGTLLYDDSPVKLAFNEQGVVNAQSAYSVNPDESTLGTITVVNGPGRGTDLFATGSIRSGSIAAYKELRDDTLVKAQSQLDAMAATLSMASGTNNAKGTYFDDTSGTGYKVDVTNLGEGNTLSVAYRDASGDHTMSFVAYDSSKLASSASPPTGSLSTDPSNPTYAIDIAGGVAAIASQIESHLPGYNVAVSTVTDDKGTSSDTSDDVDHQMLSVFDDGSETLQGMSGSVNSGGLQWGDTALPLFIDGGSGKSYSGLVDGSDSVRGLVSRITVNPDVMGDPAYMVDYASNTPSGDGSRPQAILDNLSGRTFYYSADTGIGSSSAPYHGSVETYLNQVVSTQGANSELAQQQADGQEVVTSNLQSRYDDSRKVDLDSELSNLIQLQTAYSANARVMTVAKEMLDTLMDALR
jgi:flagellar hook-associated protein 1 FlgK